MVERAAIDGVPVFFAPREGHGTTAGLVFRVGRADETLGTSGITHLVEHLALHTHGVTDYHYNGSVGATTTQFVMQGSEEEVASFLGGIARALGDLPIDRLQTEKEILRTESQSKTNGVNALMPLWRYGAQNFGLVSYPEWGLARLSAGDVAKWAQTRFCRENAALWIAGDRVPASLSLNLPTGTRYPLAATTSAVPRFPAYFTGPVDGIVLEALVPRSVAASVLAAVVQRMLLRILRHDSGISYTVDTDYSPRGDDRATITVFADATPDKHQILLGTIGDALKGLTVRGIDSEDLESIRRNALESLDHPDVEAARLPSMAVNELTGHPNPSLAELRTALETITIDEVNAVGAQLLDGALLQVPYGHRAEQLGFEPAPTTSTHRVSGTTYRSRSDDGSTVIVGQTGVTVTHASGDATVLFEDCAARLDWPDGGRHYLGLDGITVRLEPTVHAIGAKDIAELDDGLPGERIIPMPARPADQIPQPNRASPARREQRRVRRRKIEAAIMPVFTGLLVWWFITEANAWRPEDGQLAERIILVIFFVAAVAALRTVLLFVWRFQRRQW